MRRQPGLPVLAVALAAGLLVAACGSEDNGGVIAGDPNTPATAPPAGQDTIPPGGEALLVESTPGLDGVTVTAIDSVVLVDDTTLEVRFYNGVRPCYGVDHVTVDDTPTAVTVEVGVGSNPDAGGVACIEVAELQGVRVTLSGPLGDRAVVDASTGAPVPTS